MRYFHLLAVSYVAFRTISNYVVKWFGAIAKDFEVTACPLGVGFDSSIATFFYAKFI